LNGCTALGGTDFNLKVAISRKRCEIGPRLQLITNRSQKFRLTPKAMTLNDLQH